MFHIKRLYILLWTLLTVCTAKAQPHMFTHMDAFDGLSDNKIQHILQLPDGRMVFTTPLTVNLYDGMRFRYFSAGRMQQTAVPAYTGAYHVYQGEGDLLWIKDYQKLFCFDVRRERFLDRPGRLLQQLNSSRLAVSDIFLDTQKTIWLVRSDGSVWNTRLKKLFRMPAGNRVLQDLDVAGGKGYFFFSSGKVVCMSLHTGKVEYVSDAYPAAEAPAYEGTSLVVKGPDGCFYQLRNGRSAICLRFNPNTRKWKTLLKSPSVLHTLIVPATGEAFITCGKGLWRINLKDDRCSYMPSVNMVEGSSVVTDINTIFIDRDKGWWLGTSHKGLLYGHPWRDAWNTAGTENNRWPRQTFQPLLINVSVDGKTLGAESGQGSPLMTQAAPFTSHLDFKYNQNSVAFDFSALNYALPVQTYYRYRLLSSTDTAWHTASFNDRSKTVDERGVLHLPYSRLKPGTYRLQVMAGNTPDMKGAPLTEITFSIRSPWWLTVWAYICYACIAAVAFMAVVMFKFHRRRRRKREQLPSSQAPQDKGLPSLLTPQDNEFLQKATELVIQHLNGPYSVEELSRDLCMERTGLYKKLTALLEQSPSLFIRNVRLQQAARLLTDGNSSISEVAIQTGFSSSSYFSKCFQERYGCKPSEYAGKYGKST